MYDEFYLLKQDNSVSNANEKANESILLLSKINLLALNLEALIKLYESILLLEIDLFIDIKTKILNNFTLIDQKIQPLFFEDLAENYNLINRFLVSYQTTYHLHFKVKEQEVEKEITNVYKIVASVGEALRIQLNVKEMPVLEWLSYEENAIAKLKAQKQSNNGE